MGPSLPPQRKGRIPLYCRDKLDILQMKFDELQAEGVFARPEEVGVNVEYVNQSFLVKKGTGYRLVSSFGQVAEFAKPQPTVAGNVENVLLTVGRWKYLIKSDLKWAYYQLKMHKNSMKYLGVATPFKGTLVYTRSVMGLPGSEAALEEILNRVLGDLIQQGGVCKLSDDLYVGSDTMEGLLEVWKKVLQKLHLNGFKLSPKKTIINPTSTIILGWLWEQGTLRATPHRLNALMQCTPPESVQGLRSFIGSYKWMSRVLPFYADRLDPLEEVCSSSKSSDKVQWTEVLTQDFEKAQKHLEDAKTVVIPRPDDQLHLVTDAAMRTSGIASALYVIRNGKKRLAGYFNAKRKSGQATWLPCEVEALSIGCGVKHFGPYISQSMHPTRIHTDSKACVLAHKKLCRGEFSVSPRVTTFLSIASRYKVEVIHIAGKDNVFSDYMSRNPITCNGSCQVCDFVQKTEDSVVGAVTVGEILSGEVQVPFTSRSAWYQTQQKCPDLARVSNYLKDGISPSKKRKGIINIRRYLNSNVKLSTSPRDNLLIVTSSEPFKQTTQRIVIPTSVSDGLVTALHLQLNHPSRYQLKAVFNRAFFALDLNRIADQVTDSCHTCAALKKIPAKFHQQTTSESIDRIGEKYSSDVMKRYGQCILLLRESISSYSDAVIISDERADTLRDAIIQLASKFRSPTSPKAIIRTDPSTSLQALLGDKSLLAHNLILEIGEPKNKNKNPEAEKSIEELHAELVRVQPLGGKISDVTLATAVSALNGRLRHNNLSATEIWTQRDMLTGSQLKVSDKKLISDKIQQRIDNHTSSAKYKSRGKLSVLNPVLKVGEIVYIYSDRLKTKSREKYLVMKVEDNDVLVQKFIGNQLRAKQYKVKKSNIITVASEPIRLRLENDSDSGSEIEFEKINHPENLQHALDLNTAEEGIENPEDAVVIPEEEVIPDDVDDLENLQAVAGTPPVVLRQQRERRRPGHLKDFILDESIESE